MTEWLGPSDDWPQHPRHFWRPVLKQARRAGWHLQPFDHDYGRIACSTEAADACVILVDCTRAGAEAYAIRAAQKKIPGCPHKKVEDDDLDEKVERAVELLREASTLTAVAARLLESEESWVEAQELLGQAEDDIDEVDRLIEAASLAERTSIEMRIAATAEFLEVDGEISSDSTASEILVEAERRADEVTLIAESDDDVAEKLRSLNSRIRRLREQMR